MDIDQVLYYSIHSLAGRSPLLDFSIVFCAVYLPIIITLCAVFFVGMLSIPSREKMYILIEAVVAALVSRYVVTALIRLFMHRLRPFTVPGSHSLFITSGSAFPSGHASVLFAVGTVLYMVHKKAGAWFFVASTIVCVARVAAGVHYPLDVIAGACVGIVSGYFVFRLSTYIVEHYR